MHKEPEAASPLLLNILTGHFTEGPSYKTWRARGSDSWLMIYTIGGGGRFGNDGDGGDWQAKSGDLVLVRPHARHDYGTSPEMQNWDFLWAHFHPRPYWQELMDLPVIAPGLTACSFSEPIVRAKVHDRFLDMHRLATSALRRRELFSVNALEEVLLWCSVQNDVLRRKPQDRRVQEIMDLLCGDLSHAFSLDELAARFNLSTSRISHLFQEATGVTPLQYQEKQRLEYARHLLDLSGRNVSEIACLVGYENPFYFTARFKKHMGFSPRDYRKRDNATGKER